MKIKSLLVCSFFAISCGGSGGGSGGETSLSGKKYQVDATVTADTCGERLAPVTQVFSFSNPSQGNIVVDTSLIKVSATDVGGTISGGISEQNGDCVRFYNFEFSDLSGAGVTKLTSKTDCPAFKCETSWTGVATEISTTPKSDRVDKVRGENCNGNIPAQVGYRPSLFECNGNAAVLLSGNQRSNHSVVVRRNGQFNDRDPNNPSCGTNRCSPYKTQKKIELPEYQVNCLGGSGFADSYDGVKRISIKYFGLITNANDTTQFEQYCINNVEESFN